VQRTLSWLVATLGIIAGLFGLTMFGEAWVETDPSTPTWLTSRFEAAGLGLLGLVFLVGSLAALRNRRRAAIIFVATSPIVAFILAYPSAGFWFTEPDGTAYYRLPDLSPAILLSCIFFAPFLAPLASIRNRKRAVFLGLFFASVLGLAVGIWQKTYVLLLPLVAWWALFLAFAAFWWGTHQLAWQELLPVMPRSLARRLARWLVECLVITVLCLTATLGLAIVRSSLWTPDCSGPSLYMRPLRANHTVFTARLLRVGHTAKGSGKWAGDWGIGLVQESFWGLPKWAPRLVLVTNSIFWEGETFFISGMRSGGLLTRFLPIIDSTSCSALGAVPRAYAEIQLRLLRKPPPDGELRIIGYARSPILGAKAWTTAAVSDGDRVYESVLAPGIRTFARCKGSPYWVARERGLCCRSRRNIRDRWFASR
jgi:hypothetical protein